MAAVIVESAGVLALREGGRTHTDPFSGHTYHVSARAQKARALKTAIRADVGESEGYKAALLRGEIGLQRPLDANVRGVDFITAIRDGQGGIREILLTDVKTSTIGRFPKPKTEIPGTWMNEVQRSVGADRLDGLFLETQLPSGETYRREDPALAQAIREAYQQDRVRVRQLNANYSESGQGMITGWHASASP